MSIILYCKTRCYCVVVEVKNDMCLNLPPRICANGHENPFYARFCKECGSALELEPKTESEEGSEKDLGGSVDLADKLLAKLEDFTAVQNQHAERVSNLTTFTSIQNKYSKRIENLEKELKDKSD